MEVLGFGELNPMEGTSEVVLLHVVDRVCIVAVQIS